MPTETFITILCNLIIVFCSIDQTLNSSKVILLSLAFYLFATMFKINFNDFFDLLSNKNVKNIFTDIVTSSISTKLDDLQATINSFRLELAVKNAVINRIEQDNQRLIKLVNDLFVQIANKLDGLQDNIDSLRLELAAKDSLITRIERDNQRLTKLVNDLSAQNDILLQDTKCDNFIIYGIEIIKLSHLVSAVEAVSAGTNNTSS